MTLDRDNGVGEYMLVQNRNLLYTPKPNSGDFNAVGLRGEVFSIQKPPGKTRIMFVGDSVIEGVSLPAEARFTERLNEHLGERFEVINLAVPGYDLRQEVEYFKTKGAHYNPDHVVFGITSNDEGLHSVELSRFFEKSDFQDRKGFYREYYQWQAALKGWLLYSNTYRYAMSHSMYYLSPKQPDESENQLYDDVHYNLDQAEIAELIDELIALSTSQDFSLSFIFLPEGEGNIAENIATESLKKKVRVWDLNEYVTNEFGETYRNRLFFDNDIWHFNSQGHQQIADILFANMDRIL